MQQADPNNIIKLPSPIERLWEKHKAAKEEKARLEALAADADDDAACDQIEAACDAAYNAIEGIGDEILAAKVTSETDIAIKARILKWYGCVEDLGYYRPEAILEFFDELQAFAAR